MNEYFNHIPKFIFNRILIFIFYLIINSDNDDNDNEIDDDNDEYEDEDEIKYHIPNKYFNEVYLMSFFYRIYIII